MVTKPGWSTAYLTKKTKQRYYGLRLVGERIEDTFERIAKTAELIKERATSNEDIFETAKRLISVDNLRQKTIDLLRPFQLPNETILDTLQRIISTHQSETPTLHKTEGDPLIKTRTVI